MNIENELKENGFSDKDLKRMKEVLSREHNKDETLASLVTDLSKRFWGGVISLIAVILVAILGIIYNGLENPFPYAFSIILGLVIVYFVTPMNLAWKAHKYTKLRK